MKQQSSISGEARGALHQIQRALLGWYAANASDLPWRRRSDPYAVLISEFMLQQTQRERVIPKFLAFMEEFPTVQHLAAVPAASVIRAWAGLGYNRRALRLHQIAKSVAGGAGAIPDEIDALKALPGIGDYTAGAIACFGFGQQVTCVDTNIRRVLRRVLCGDVSPRPSPKLDADLAVMALPPNRAVEWNSALMDLGALICKTGKPRCDVCPLAQLCAARPQFLAKAATGEGVGRAAEEREVYRTTRTAANTRAQPFKSTDRYLRGRIIDALRRLADRSAMPLSELSIAATGMALPAQHERVALLVERLVREGMVIEEEPPGEERRYRLPD